MKKFFSMLLCIAVLFTFFGCAEETIGDYIENYPETVERVENLTLNLYIVVEEGTSENAKTTVKRMINQHTVSEYNTTLNVHYVSEADYTEKVTAAAKSTGSDAAHIVLINGLETMNALCTKNGDSYNTVLCDLSTYLDSRDYGTLNVQIPSALLQGAKRSGKLYALPNNHIIGEYEYLVIDKEVAHQVLKFSDSVLRSYTSLDDAAELITAMNRAGYDSSSLVYTTKGNYAKRAELEALNGGNYCNIISYPTVDEAEAFSSAFAVVSREQKYNDRAMQIIYAINTDVELRNLLQYGVSGTNYEIVDGNVVRNTDETNAYFMNLKYTGDIFKAYYCSELNWTKVEYEIGSNQNDDSITK